MSHTIDWLETIGSDASLRCATATELQAVLERAHASAELIAAVATGNGAPLRVKLGIRRAVHAPQTQSPGLGDGDKKRAPAPSPAPPVPPAPPRPLPPDRPDHA